MTNFNSIPTFLKKNYSALSLEDQRKLLNAKVTIIGCGGLGGYVIELLTRIGVGFLRVCDGDEFEETNLNRQILSTRKTIGKKKAVVAKDRIKDISIYCNVEVVDKFVQTNELDVVTKDSDVVVDAIGGISFKKELVSFCQTKNIPVVTGAVAGFEGFVSSVIKSSTSPIGFFYGEDGEGAENVLGCPPTTVSIIATIMVQEVVTKICFNRFNLKNKILFVDLKNLNFHFFDL